MRRRLDRRLSRSVMPTAEMIAFNSGRHGRV
jgi:hypothetical protein